MNKINGNEQQKYDSWLPERGIIRYLTALGAYLALVLSASLLLLLMAGIFSEGRQSLRELVYGSIPIISLFVYSALTTKTREGTPYTRLFHVSKRMQDVLFSSLALFFLCPLMICIALAIKLDSRGPVLHRSRRIGQYGRLIEIYRFRVRTSDQPRLPFTKVGKIISPLALDELPMLYNVLEGDLSLVGPRPRHPECVQQEVDPYKLILTFRPGITGLWQVSDEKKSDLQSQLELDLEYIAKCSVRLDSRIVLKTMLLALFRQETDTPNIE
jgi:lipopolysaccharide/colanic/teichoic acid biosynthesis glycosyltransferase